MEVKFEAGSNGRKTVKKNIYLDKHLSFVDETDDDEKIYMDNEEVGNFIVLDWFWCSSFYDLLLPYPFDLDTNYRWKAKPKPMGGFLVFW